MIVIQGPILACLKLKVGTCKGPYQDYCPFRAGCKVPGYIVGRAFEKSRSRRYQTRRRLTNMEVPKHLCCFGRVPPCRIKVYWGLQYCDLLFMEATKTFCFRAQTGVEQKELEHTVQAPTPQREGPNCKSLNLEASKL